MSKQRPTLLDADPLKPSLDYKSTYFRVLQAVSSRRSLIHGKLANGNGRTCAIGAYFQEATIPIDGKASDEIAAYNDSFPKLSNEQRWRKVMAWLRFLTEAIRKGT